jgi:hypothetical protein
MALSLLAIYSIYIDGHICETAIVNYRLSFADQGKKTSVLSFRFQQTNGRLPFPFYVCSKQTEVVIFC